MGTCFDPQVNCDTCFEVLIGDCLDDINLSLGLTPSTLFFFRLIDKFGATYDFSQITDGSGDFTLDRSQLPDGLINQFAGEFQLEVFADSGRTELVNVVQNSITYNCVLLTQELSGSNNLTPPDVFISQFSFLLDGLDERIDCGNDASLNFERTDAFSVAGFVKVSDLSTSREFFGKEASVGAMAKGWGILILTDGTVRIQMAHNGSDLIRVTTIASHIVVGTWTGIIMTYDGSSNASGVTIYINGLAVADVDNFDTLGAGDTIQSTASAFIGMGVTSTGVNTRFMAGNEDEISVWKKELSAAEALSIGIAPTDLLNNAANNDLVSWWRCGEKAIWDSANWTLPDQKGSNDGTSINMEFTDKVQDTI